MNAMREKSQEASSKEGKGEGIGNHQQPCHRATEPRQRTWLKEVS